MSALKFFVKSILPKWLLRLLIFEKRFELNGRKPDGFYKNNTVFCPCCGKSFIRFMDFGFPFGANPERYRLTFKNTICPYCFSMARHRIVCHYFSEIFATRRAEAGSILIFGAEYSILKWFDRGGYHYTTADLFDRTADIKVDIQNTPFSDESWKLIICNHILEHVPDYKKALQELKRILANKGILEITVPTDRNFDSVYEDVSIINKKERVKAFGQYDHVRVFGNDFEKTLIESGFSVEVIDGNKLPNEIVGVIGPADYDDNRVYICRKNNGSYNRLRDASSKIKTKTKRV